MMGNAPLWTALKERNEICNASEFTDAMMERLGELEVLIADENGYMAEIEAADILRGIGIEDARHTDLMSTLPTDFKFRVLLAQAVFGNPEALLLDEPTNHMDLESIHWLEGFLHAYEGTLIVISHDRHFLNAVCTHIADIDYDTIILYPGIYDDMVESKMQSRQSIENETATKQEDRAAAGVCLPLRRRSARHPGAVTPERDRASGPHGVEKVQYPAALYPIEQTKPAGREVVVAKGLCKSFDGREILKGVNLDILRGDRVAIIGGNGVGKTTLLRCLIGDLTPEAGAVRWGHGMTWGYYPQNAEDEVAHGQTALEWLMQFEPTGDQQIVRGLMDGCFQRDDGLKPPRPVGR